MLIYIALLKLISLLLMKLIKVKNSFQVLLVPNYRASQINPERNCAVHHRRWVPHHLGGERHDYPINYHQTGSNSSF